MNIKFHISLDLRFYVILQSAVALFLIIFEYQWIMQYTPCISRVKGNEIVIQLFDFLLIVFSIGSS